MGCKYCGKPVIFLRSRPLKTKNHGSIRVIHDTYRWACNSCGRHEQNGTKQASVAVINSRKLKVEAHRLVDYYWHYDEYSRGQVYNRIRRILKLRPDQHANISKLNDAQLRKLIQVVNEGNFLHYKRVM